MNLGVTEMIFIFFIALLIFGPKKLPELGKNIGKALSEFKRASNELKNQLDEEVRQLDLEETRKQVIAPPAVQAEIQSVSRGSSIATGTAPAPQPEASAPARVEDAKEPHA